MNIYMAIYPLIFIELISLSVYLRSQLKRLFYIMDMKLKGSKLLCGNNCFSLSGGQMRY